MRRFALAVAILSTLIAPAIACDAAADKVAAIAVANPGSQIQRLNADQTRVVLAAYNAEPPVSNLVADMIYVLSSPRIPAVLLLFAAKDCTVAQELAPVGWLQAVLAGRLAPL